MAPRELRERLFKPEKPLVRRLEILDGDQYTSDMGVLWAAYVAGSFNIKPDLSQDEFVKMMEQYFSVFNQVWVVDDRNSGFAKGSGPIGLVLSKSADLLMETQFSFFKWASKRNIMRATASFLQMMKNSTGVGVCMIRATEDKRTLPDHMKKYELLHFVGRISKREYLYSVRGRGSNG